MAQIKGFVVALATVSLLVYVLPARASVLTGAGGSNYIAVNLNADELNRHPSNWQNSSVFEVPACVYKTQGDKIAQDLRTYYLSGQRRISLVLWLSHLPTNSKCKGFLVNSQPGTSRDEVVSGVNYIIKKANQIGFKGVAIRFAPMWISDPRKWTDWNESLFLENESFILSVAKSVSNNNLPIDIDLGIELAGQADNPILSRYVSRLWSDACIQRLPKISFFNSVGGGRGRVARYLSWIRMSKCRPYTIYLDVYGNAANKIAFAASEARRFGINDPKIVIDETYYSDGEELRKILQAAQKERVDIPYIMQWPIMSSFPAAMVASTPSYIYNPQ